MVRFEDLQTLWQTQPSRAATPRQSAELTAAFRRFGRRHDLINLTKLFAIGIQLTTPAIYLRHRPQVLSGVCLAVFSSLVFLIRDWRAQRAVARLNFADPSTEFLHTALARLNALRDPFRNRAFYIMMAGVWVGMNLVIAGSWIAHAATLAMPYVIYRFGRFVRRRRFACESQPLIDRLTAILATMDAE